MDMDHLDTLAKRLGTRVSHRGVLGTSGVSVAAAALSLASGARAQTATPSAVVGCPATSEADNRAIVQRWYDAINAGDLDAMRDVLAPTIAEDAADFPNAASADQVVASFRTFLAAFPDQVNRVQQWLTQDNYVVARVLATGTHNGPFEGVAPTGKKVTWEAVAIFRIACGRIAQHWSEVDALGRLQQLGAIPTFAASAANTTPMPSAGPHAATPPTTCPVTSEVDNAALVLRYYDQVYNRGHTDQLDQLLAPNFVRHRYRGSDTRGSAAKRAMVQTYGAAFPDLVHAVDLVVTDGDLVAVRWSAQGTHDGSFLGINPTGKVITWTGNTIFRITCGQIAEEWAERDDLALFQQLGVVGKLPLTGPSTPTGGSGQ